MTLTTMDPVLRQLLVSRLEASDLDPDARTAVLGQTPPAREPSAAAGAREVYLRSVTVESFRGIGRPAQLELAARPGLTLVVGRNGSGKSSFAEGLELLLTGGTKRWEEKTKGWTSSWQCLHGEADAPTRLAAELVVAGESEPVVLEQRWARGVTYDDTTDRAGVAAVLGARGLDAALQTHRPFLAYAELAAMFDKTTSLYKALSPILGLEEVDEVLKRLSERRLELQNRAKAVKAGTGALRARLLLADARQAELDRLLAKRAPALPAIRSHLDAHPHGTSSSDPASASLRQIGQSVVPDDETIRVEWAALEHTGAARESAAATDAGRALATADLLTRALRFRSAERLADDCPVCGTTDVLDDTWVAHASAEAERLRVQAAELDAATRAEAAATSAWSTLVGGLQRLAGEAASALDVDGAVSLAGRVRASVAKARALLEGQDTDWRDRIEETTAWLADAKVVAREAHGLKALVTGEKWLKQAADELRNERFAPIAQQAIANWEQLKHESNVELKDITLRTSGRNREATFDVRADGAEANALGVMSQGELLALAVSVFLPRAGLDESPFRFAVIDDPVQSMDPAKVDGLARVLARAAQTRQVVVFTHDDRLPEAVRRLKLPADVFQVLRRTGSVVDVEESRTSMRRHLDDAKSLNKSPRVPVEVRQRVVPALCRSAVEAACAELVRKQAIAHGEPVAAADERLAKLTKLRPQLAAALAVDPEDGVALNAALERVEPHAVGLVGALNAGAHGEFAGSTAELHRRTSDFVTGLMQAS